MKILKNNSDKLKNVSLILGFFDGIHSGHRAVIESAHSLKVILTFKQSPSEYFGNKTKYIYPREHSYELAEKLGVEYIIEQDFGDIVDINAIDYLKQIVQEYSPVVISTGFNYSFGKNKEGSPDLLAAKAEELGYKYICTEPYMNGNKTVCSTYIKSLIEAGDLKNANKLLTEPFEIKSTVIEGNKLGRQIGFPTANMNYPDKIVKLPYGVYKCSALNKSAILNWGVKPTIDGKHEILEVHIPNFTGDLYGQELNIKIIEKVRDEIKFNNIDELKIQIEKDTKECLK